MIDTLAIVSPVLAPALRDDISSRLGYMRRVDEDGHMNFEMFTGELLGSYDHRTSVRVTHDGRLRIEGSIHKSIDGTNFANGPISLLPACSLYISLVELHLGVSLPSVDAWKPHRVDIARVYELASLQAVEAAIDALKVVRVRNRAPSIYQSHGLRWGGVHDTLKVYAKGPEFRHNDRKRYREACRRIVETKSLGFRPFDPEAVKIDPAEFQEVASKLQSLSSDPVDAAVQFMQNEADRLLRVEVEMKRKAIEHRIGPSGTVPELTDEIMRDYFWKHLEPMTLTSPERDRVNTHEAVRARLVDVYGSRLASALYATWVDLSIDPDAARRGRTRSTLYDHKKKLRAASCEWIGSDIVKRSPLLPADLVFRPESPYLLPDVESSTVAAALAPHRAAA